MTKDCQSTPQNDLIAQALSMDSPEPPSGDFWAVIDSGVVNNPQLARLDDRRKGKSVKIALLAAAVVAAIAAIGLSQLVGRSNATQDVAAETNADRGTSPDSGEVAEPLPEDPIEPVPELEIGDSSETDDGLDVAVEQDLSKTESEPAPAEESVDSSSVEPSPTDESNDSGSVDSPSRPSAPQDTDSDPKTEPDPDTNAASEPDPNVDPDLGPRPEPDPDPEPEPEPDSASVRDLIVGDWINESGTSYVPSDVPVPLRRYRQRINIRENGTASFLVLGPDDGHFLVNGPWELTDNNTVIEITVTSQDREADYIRDYVGLIIKIKILDLLPGQNRLELEVRRPAAPPIEPAEPEAAEAYTYLIGEWAHDTGSTWVPANEDLPIRRFRRKLNVRADGTASLLIAGPDDGHFYVHGPWLPLDDDSIQITVNAEDRDLSELGERFNSYIGAKITIQVLDPLRGEDGIELKICGNNNSSC